MAEIYVRAPDGTVGTIDDSEAQAAAEAGYQVVSQEDIRDAQESEVADIGGQAAAAQGLLTAPDDYSTGRAFAEKAASAATFGLAPGLDTPGAIARGQRYQAEHPWGALGAEVVGQLPLAVGLEVATGGLAGAAGIAGRGLAARAGFKAGEVGVQAAAGGAQTEAEQTRLAQDEFSWTDAAVTGLAGEVIGRGAGLGFSSALGASRNLIARATRQTVAEDAASSLTKGGILNDFRVAHHAEQYQNELSTLAADDLDKLETSFQEVSRQDRKRSRITRVVVDNPEAQAAVRAEAQAGLSDLYDALSGELGDAPGPARHLLKQLDERMDALGAGGGGKKLWRLLDENRQALQEYAQDLHQAYENAPGSAWLSREGLAKLDAAEKATREALLREDVWGPAAAREQAAYNVPFHEKYFPTSKTVRGKLMQTTGFDARGFPVFRGDPGKVKAFLTRGVDDVDSARLGEQFRDYLDGVAAIARTSEKDTPAAARETLEAVRRLRKAVANAEYISAAAKRSTGRERLAELGVEAVGAGVGVAAMGPLGGAATFAALRGARTGDFLMRAARKLGWGAGEAEDMAALLGRDALPAAAGKDAPVSDGIDDLLDSAGPSTKPPSGGGPPGGGGLTPSEMAPDWRPSGPPEGPAGAGPATGIDDPAPEPGPESLRPGREARAARPTTPTPGREVGRGQAERLEIDPVREAGVAQRREARRLGELTEGEFREVVRQLEGSPSERAKDFAEKLKSNLDSLKTAGLVVAGAGGAAALADDQPEGAAGAGFLGLSVLLGKKGPIVSSKHPLLKSMRKELTAALKNLTPDEQLGMAAYSVDSAQIRKALAGEASHPQWQKAAYGFESAVKKLAVPDPTSVGPLYRGLGVPTAQAEALATADQVVLKDFSSTSYAENVADDFARHQRDPIEGGKVKLWPGKQPVMLVFEHVDEGTPNMPLGQKSNQAMLDREAEVILQAGVFDVVRREEKDGALRVFLRQAAQATSENQVALSIGLGLGAAGLAADDSPEGAAGAAAVGIGLLRGKLFPKAVKLAAESLKAGNPPHVVEKDLFKSIREEGLGTEEGARAEAKAVLAAAQDQLDSPVADTVRLDVAKQLDVSEYLLSDASSGFGKKLSGPLGSNEGGWYEMPSGAKAYVKFYDAPEQAVSEHAANVIYGKNSAAETRLFVDGDGRVAHVSYDQNGYNRQEWTEKALADVTPAEARVFVKDFWKDVLLANWDVVGMTGDNLLWREAGAIDGLGVKRIDNGSSLKYRAQGAEKPAGALGKLSEIEGFFNAEMNPNYAGLLRKAGVTSPYDLVQELHQLLDGDFAGVSSRLSDFSPEVRNLLTDRMKLLKDYATRLESPRLRQLRENLGASRRLGAGFRGDDGEAFEIVESYKSERGGPSDHVLPPPPPRGEAIEGTGEELRAHPGLNRLVEVSKARVDALSREQRNALMSWVGSSRAIRAVTAGGLDPMAERASKYGPGADPVKSKAMADAFNSAMEELTVVDPTKHGPLFRFIDLNDRALAELLQKDEFVVTAPTSTGYVPDPNFGGTEFRFRKVDSAGALIGFNPSESEMILLADSRFRKVGQFWDPEGEHFVFEFEAVPETTKSPAWGDIGHLGLGPLALAAGALADPEGAVEDGVAAETGAPTAAASGFGAAAALFKAGRGRVVRDVARRLFSAAAEPTLRTTARLVYSREQLAARQEEFHAWQQDPDSLVARVAEGLRDAPPEAFSQASTGVFAAAAFLREKLPQSSKPSPVALRGVPVSAEASAKYARYEQAALRPGEAVREGAESGYLSPELLETLQALYPDLLAELRVEAYDTIRAGGGAGLSIQAKAQYARLFDGDGSLADPAFSPTAVQMVNMAYEEAAQVAPPKAGASPRPGVSQMAVAVAAPAPWRTA